MNKKEENDSRNEVREGITIDKHEEIKELIDLKEKGAATAEEIVEKFDDSRAVKIDLAVDKINSKDEEKTDLEEGKNDLKEEKNDFKKRKMNWKNRKIIWKNRRESHCKI